MSLYSLDQLMLLPALLQAVGFKVDLELKQSKCPQFVGFCQALQGSVAG